MSDNSDGIAHPGSSSQPPPTETITSVSAQIGQGDVGAWNFDNIEDKNPFSEFSEEHLNKLDEVLSSVEVREILQQSATDFSLDMSLEDGNQPGSSTGSSQPIELQESDLSVLSAAFSDHAYAVPPSKAPKTKPAVVTPTERPKPIVVTVGPSEIPDMPMIIRVPPMPSIVPQAADSPSPPMIEVSPPSPVSVSPRKSGRPAKSKRYGDEEWVTSSPRGRGRGRGSRTESPIGFGNLSYRQSSRISDQKQRELAEKILQANRQALEAEKLGGAGDAVLGVTEQPEGVGRGRGRKAKDEEDFINVDDSDSEEKSPGKGRGRGRGRGRPKKEQDEVQKVGKTEDKKEMVVEKTEDGETEKEIAPKEELETKAMVSSQDEISEDIINQSVSEEKQTGEDVKSGEESHGETDSEEEKKKPVRKKPKKSVWETKRRKKKKKPVKKKAVVKKTEETDTSGSEGESDTDNEKKAKVTVKGKKLAKVKGKLKGKKLKVKMRKGKSKQEDSESSDLETGKKPVGKKKVKKLTKQELVQRLKDAKTSKKTKLLEKKKAKLKEKKGKLKASGTESDKSPKKKKIGKETTDSDITSDKQEKPVAKKKITKNTKDKEDASDIEEKSVPKGKKKGLVAETASPTKKKKGKLSEEKPSGDQSLVKKKKGKLIKDTTDSESKDLPKKKKGKLLEDKTDSESPNSPKKKKGKQPAVKQSEESEGEQKKGKKVLKGKKGDSESATEPDSPQKKKKTKLKGEKIEEDKTEMDTKKSPTNAGKRKEVSATDSAPAKKQKIETLKDKPEVKVSLSDSDEDVPLKKIKKDLQEDSESKDEKKDSHEIPMETSDTKILEQTKEQTDQSLKTDEESKVNEIVHASDIKADDAKVVTESQAELKSSGKITDSEMEKKESVSEGISEKVDKSDDKKDNKRKLSLDKDSFETPSKRRDSRDSKDSRDDKNSSHHRHRHHSHHHHRHSRDSRESVSEERKHSRDKKDSHKDRRKHSHSSSHERKKSDSGDKDKERRDSHDRKGSVSKDRRDSLKDLPSDKNLKKGERRSSIASANSDQKDTKTPGKIEKKKSRKSEDIPVDSSWIDLFKPDVTPKQKDRIKSEQSMEDSVYTPLKEGAAVSVEAKLKSDSASAGSTSSLEDTEKGKENNEQKVSKENLDKVSILEKFKNIVKESDNINIISEDTKKEERDSTSETVLDAKENASANMNVENLVDIKTEAQSSPDNLLKPHDSDNLPDTNAEDKKLDVVSEKGITEDSEKVKKSKVEGENIEKVKIGESEFHIVKVPVSSTMKKEKTPKESSEKKAVDKTKLLKDLKAKLTGDKERKRDSKDIKEGKAEKVKGLSTDKTKKLSPVRKGIMKKVTPEKKHTESAKKRRLSGEGTKKRNLSGDSAKKRHVSREGKARPSRNKSVAFAEILKKEKLGSDDEESDNDSDFNDDETDETWEEPGKLYCLCRQPHNQRFMICCDKCEEWFHGKCVGISRARGEEMEKNDEEYICPQCSEKENEAEEKEEKTVVTSTESPDQPHKKAEVRTTDSKERVSLFESLSTADTTSSQHGVEKSELPEIAKPDSTVSSPVKRDSLDSETSAKGKPAGEHTPTKVKHGEGDSPRKGKSPDGDKGNVGYIRKRSPKKDSTGADKKKMIKSFEPKKPKVVYSQRKCICGCNRLAKIGSQYSTKECEVRRAEQRKEENEAAKKAPVKVPQERRVAVVEKGTGKTLTGHKAPRESELKDWLQKHPTFEVLKSHRRISLQSQSSTAGPSKDKASDSSEVSDKEKSGDDSHSEKPLPEGPEPVRLNVRKGLRDALAARADAAEDIVLSNSEIKGLSLAIEEEMFNCFKDTDHKYKAKYRSLVFNIKDHKNNGLFRKILNRRIRPNQLVRMTPEELASQELTKWREHEAKHQLEMIEQTEAELQQEHPHITKKTHKGEVEVEEEGEEDLSSLSVAEPKKEAPKIDPKADVLSVILPDTTEQHGKHLFDSNCRVCTGKIVPHTESSDTTSKTTVVVTEPQPEEEEEEPTQKEKDLQAEEVVKEVLKAIKKAQAEVQREALESQKKANAVTVRSPDSALSSGLEKKTKFTPSGPQLWKGFVYMQDVSKFVTSAYRVTGPADNLDLPDTIHVCGRINPEHVWDYLSKIKQAASRDICVIRFIPGNNEEKVAYINLYSYLNSRSRCGVVANSAKHIKDFYIVPLASHSKIPAVLKPFDGPGLEENRCHMLIGVIIRNKVKSSTVSGTSSQSQKQDPRKLKSNLKDPALTVQTKIFKDPDLKFMAADEKSTSSSSSSPTSSASSLTPQEKKKKAKSISFDPIVKEYSHVSSDLEEPDVTYDPNAPYDPEKEAETTTPKQEDRPYSPSQGEVLGISEFLKTSHKQKSKEDTVSKMIEKIALSKNPIEATATMVAALATSSRLGNQNQRKLLLELTKKVDEQKKLLEQKRISSKSGRSPSSISSTTSNSPSEKATRKSGLLEDLPSTSGSSPHSNKSQLNKNDPRLKSKDSKTSVSKESSVSASGLSITDSAVSGLVQETVPTVYSPHKELQAAKAAQAASRLATSTDTESDNTATGTKDSAQSSPAKKLFSFTLKTKSHTVTKSAIEDENETKSSLPKLDEELESVVKPKGFYIDHGEKTVKENDNSKDITLNKADRSETSTQGGAWKVVTNEASEPGQMASVLGKLGKLSNVQESATSSETISAKLESDLKESGKADSQKDKVTDSKPDSDPVDKEEKSHSDKGYDIVSQLQAEVSGASTRELKDSGSEKSENKEAFDILSQLHASVWGTKGKDQNKESSQTTNKTEAISKSSLLVTDSSKSSVKLPPNILNILKEVTDKPAKVQPKQEDSPQSGQLPNALMSLFPKIPSNSKTDSESKSEPSVGDEDLRLQSKKMAISTNVSASQKLVNPALEAKAEIKVSKDKLTKSFLGFDYDSDSDSEGSFEGFDDDGVKSLSPRKRKLVAKQSPISSQNVVSGSTNEFGDVDIRVKPKQDHVKIAGMDMNEDEFEFPSEDVDLRQLPTSIKSKESEHEKNKEVTKEHDKVDKDERVQQEPGLQPQPPGEELEKHEFPIDIDERIKRRVPPGVVFTTPDTDKMGIRPPVLSDVDHRTPGFPGSIPPGLRPLLPFMGSNQPPPPGEDWQPGQPAPPPLPPAPLVKPPPLPKGLPPPPPEKPKLEEPKTEKEKEKIEEKDKDNRTAEETKELAADESEVKDKKVKKDKKGKKEKKKGGPLTSDERLKAIVLEIARKEPIEPPPLPPILKPSVPLPMPMPVPVFSGPPPLSCPPGPMISAPGPIFTEPPTLSVAPPLQAATAAVPFASQGSSMPLLTPESSHPPGPWQGSPATSSTGPPSLFEIDVKPPGKRSSRPPILQPTDPVNPSPPPVPPNFTPSKQGLLPTPPMPPSNQIPQPANQIQGQGPLGPTQPLVGPNTVSSIGTPPMGMNPRGSNDSPRIGPGDDSYPPPLIPEVKGFSDEREPEDRGSRHRDRHDRHSRNRDDDRDRDRHRHGRHRDDRGHRSSRDRHDHSDRRSSDRHRDDHHRDNYHRDEGRGRDDDRRRDRSRSRDDRHGHRHKKSRH